MSQYSLKELCNSRDVAHLNQIIRRTSEKMEGNILYRHHSDFKLHLENKETARWNLFEIAKSSRRILEIGFNGGHSAALYFYANPTVHLVAFDLCSDTYTELCQFYKDHGHCRVTSGNRRRYVFAYNQRVLDNVL